MRVRLRVSDAAYIYSSYYVVKSTVAKYQIYKAMHC